MSEYDDFNNMPQDETPREAAERLRGEIAAGEEGLRPELVEALLQAAHGSLEADQLDQAILWIDEAREVTQQLVDEGLTEFETTIGRCLLFRAAVLRASGDVEAALVAFNETIHYLAEHVGADDSGGRNELAVALMNKADLLIDPLGAHSTAIAAQEQAARIWEQLFQGGETEYRQSLVSTLLASSDSKMQTGDFDSALLDAQKATGLARDGLDEGDAEYRGLLMQALLKLTKLCELTGDLVRAFETSREAIGLVESLLDEGETPAEMMLTTLYLQHGMLYEKRGDSQKALELYDRCLDVYRRIYERDTLESPVDFIVKNGEANTMMCRANMLADLRRYEEASATFQRSVALYHEAMEIRPKDDEDKTFLPYSIGIVKLNHANMLVAQGKTDEAIVLKEQAIDALQRRMEAGHDEILPNILAAYRKMIGLLRLRGETEAMFDWIGKLTAILESHVDEGRLEYRSDLASAYILDAVCREEQGGMEAAEAGYLRALNLFRQLADEDGTDTGTHVAKLQWGETLNRLADLLARLGRVDDAVALFRKAIDDVTLLHAEGNEQIVFDVLLADSHLLGFLSGLLLDHDEDYELDDRRRWTREALATAESGIEICRKSRIEAGDRDSVTMFFDMKAAGYHLARGIFFNLLDETGAADTEFGVAGDLWESLLRILEQKRFEKEYYEKEAADRLAESLPLTGASAPGGDETDETAADPYRDRYLYYAGELRQTLQHRASLQLRLGRPEEARKLYERELEGVRELIRRDYIQADRYLIYSLLTFAKAMEDHEPPERIVSLYREATALLRHRFEAEEVIDDDFFMLKHVHVSLALFLLKIDRDEEAMETIHAFGAILQTCAKIPAPELWIEMCKTLDTHGLWFSEPDKLAVVRRFQRALLARHPDFETNEQLREYDRSLAELLDQ